MWALLLLSCAPWSDVDLDGDGRPAMDAGGLDCNDGDPSVYPGAPDPVGDGVDTDCDGLDGQDADGDGVASLASGGADCDDGNPQVLPGADEWCNGADDDCDGATDEAAVDALSWWPDADGDGFGATQEPEQHCTAPQSGWVSVGGDCDDFDPVQFPGADEPCGQDLGCDGQVATCPELSAAQPMVFTGRADGERAGWSVADAGDVTGDGYGDVVVGVPSADLVWIVNGPFTAGGSLESRAAASVTSAPGSNAGVSVAGVGDLHLDGFADVLIGADEDDAAGPDAGAAWVMRGPVLGGQTLTSSAAVQLLGEAAGDHAGRAVAGPGDADGDGIPDLVIGAWGHGVGGAAYVVSGDISSNQNLGDSDLKLTSSLAGAGAGWSVAGADVDGDGLADVLVGGPLADGGRLWAVPGMSGVGQTVLDLDVAGAALAGEPGDQLGWSVTAGEVDGDGFADTWVSGPGANAEAGCVWLIPGSANPQPGLADVRASAVAEICATTPGERFGERVALVPGSTEDGVPGLLVAGTGATTAAPNDGAVWLFEGITTGSWTEADASASWYGADASDALGVGLAGGDWNEDGLGDILIGVPGSGLSGYGPGAMWMFYGG